jgi:hypothetical protein
VGNSPHESCTCSHLFHVTLLGGLVRKILETKKELGGTKEVPGDKQEASLTSKEKQASRKEVMDKTFSLFLYSRIL